MLLQRRFQSHLALLCWSNDGHDLSDPASWPVGPLRHSHEARPLHLGIVRLLTPGWLHHNFLLTKRSKFLSIRKGRNEPRTHKKIVNTTVFVVFQWRHAPRLSIHVARRCFLYSCASARDQTRCGDKHPPPQPRSRHNRGSVTRKNPNLTLGSFVSLSSVIFLLAALKPWDSSRVMERMLYQTALNALGLHYCDTVRRVKVAFV